MALSRGQKEFIEGALGHLLEFPSNLNDLKKEVEKLKSTLKGPLNYNNKCYFLHRCLLKPQKTLPRLETFNDKNVSVGEVQRYIIDLITEAINTEAKKAGKTAHD